jgi:NitT/TauT family transport system permease protein
MTRAFVLAPIVNAAPRLLHPSPSGAQSPPVPLVLFQTDKVRRALKAPGSVGVDVLILVVMAAVIGALLMMGRQVTSEYHQTVVINVRPYSVLFKYTTFSLLRGCMAYVLSLAFTLVYGTIAAHNARAEKVMIPALDVLQSIPVLGFLPGLVLAMVHLFPHSEMGLEIACVVMIFTGQVWNMTFSYYGSIRGVPQPLLEAAKIYRMPRWRLFTLLELPASMIGLVWNSMMSMAGGWFFLIVNEAFTLGDKDFRLPGIGSYMNEAINQFDAGVWETWKPILAAIVAMVVMIVTVDQFFWRPIVAWSERFKLEETAQTDKPQSWVLNLLAKSRLYAYGHRVLRAWRRRHEAVAETAVARAAPAAAPRPALDVGLLAYAGGAAAAIGGNGAPHAGGVTTAAGRGDALSVVPLNYIRPEPGGANLGLQVLGWVVVLALVYGAAWGAWQLFSLLRQLPLHDPANHEDWVTVLGSLTASFARTTAAVLIGAVWTLPAGILIGLSPKWSQRLQPVVQVVASFPAPMLFPLVTIAMLAMGINFNWGCVLLMVLGAQWYILFNVIAGAMAIPGELKEVGRLFRTPWLQQWTRLYIPCVFPFLVTGLITAAGGAWNATIVSEFVQVKGEPRIAYGLGALISQATNKGNFPLLAAGICTMAVSVVVLNRLIWKRLYRAAEGRYSLQT